LPRATLDAQLGRAYDNAFYSAISDDIWNNARKLCCGAQLILATFVGVYGCKRARLRHINVVAVEIIYNLRIR